MENKLDKISIDIKLKLADIYGSIIKFGMLASGAVATFISTNKFFINEVLTNRFFIFLISETIPISITLVAIHRFSKIESELSSFCGIFYNKIINKNMLYSIFVIVLVIFCFVYFIN